MRRLIHVCDRCHFEVEHQRIPARRYVEATGPEGWTTWSVSRHMSPETFYALQEEGSPAASNALTSAELCIECSNTVLAVLNEAMELSS